MIDFKKEWLLHFGMGASLAVVFFFVSQLFPTFSFVELFQNLVFPNLFSLITDSTTRIVLVVFVAPPAEEVIFRGMLPTYLSGMFSPALVEVLSALAFMLFHLVAYGVLNTGALFAAFLFGLLASFIYKSTGDIASSIGLHMATNGIVTGAKFVSVGGVA